MPSRKTKLADELAQEVIDTWNASGTNMTPEFEALLNLTFFYTTARYRADKHRAFHILTDRDKAQVEATRSAFLRAYKIYHRRQARFN